MTIVCGKFFFHKKHKLPGSNEIEEDTDGYAPDQSRSSSINRKKYDSNDHSSYKNTIEYQNNNIDASDYPNAFSNRNESTRNSQNNNHKIKANPIHLNMNYNFNADDSTSKTSSNQYLKQPSDSFFANKLAKQPESTIKIHHHKHKKYQGYLPEIPANVLNRRINYQYTSPTKSPNKLELKSKHKRHSHNHKKENDNFETPMRKINLEVSQRKTEFLFDKFKSNNTIVEEEEEVEYENDHIEAELLKTNKKNPIYTSSNEEYNKSSPSLSVEEEDANNYHTESAKFSQNANVYTSNTNSYKSTSSYPNEEEEFQNHLIDGNGFDQLKENKKTMATSPFYKPNLQFQQFNNNEEISELSQSQIAEPSQSNQHRNHSRNNRIKASVRAKSNIYPSNGNNDFNMYQITDEQINSKLEEKSPKFNSTKNISPKQSKPNSPKISNNLSQANDKEKFANSPDNLFTNNNNFDSPEMQNDQVITHESGSSKKIHSPKDNLVSLRNFIEQQISILDKNEFLNNPSKGSSNSSLNEKKSPSSNSTLKHSSVKNNLETPPSNNGKQDSIKSKKKSSVSNSSKSSERSNNSNIGSLHYSNEQQNLNVYEKKSPISGSSKKFSSSPKNIESPQIYNELQNSSIVKNKSQNTKSLKNSSSMQIKSESPRIADDQKNSAKKKSPNYKSPGNSSFMKIMSESPKISGDFVNKKSILKSSKSPKNFSPTQTKADCIQAKNRRSDSKKASCNNSNLSQSLTATQVQIEEEEEEGETIFFERLQISDKDVSNSEKYSNDANSQYSNENDQDDNNFILNEEQERMLSGNEFLQNSFTKNNDPSVKNENFGNSQVVNDDIFEEEEEEEENESTIRKKNDEKSIVVLSELQNNGEISPLPKKKSSDYLASFHQLSADSINANGSETEINNSLVQVLKTENKEQRNTSSNSNKSIILANDEIEMETDEEISNSDKSFSSIVPSNNNNGSHLSANLNNINKSTKGKSVEYYVNIEEEEEENNEEAYEENLDLLDSRISSNDDMNTIQDVIFEEDFNVIPNDSNLLDSDDSDNSSNNSNIFNGENIILNHEIDDEMFNQNSITEEKKSANSIIDDSNNLFSDDSRSSDVDFPRVSTKLSNEKSEKNLQLRNLNQTKKNQKNNIEEDAHSSEIRFLLESSSEQNQKEDNDYKEIKSLSPKFLKEAHVVDLGDDEEDEDENGNAAFDFNDDIIKEKKEKKENSSFNALLDNYINSSFDEELRNAYNNSFNSSTDEDKYSLNLNISEDLKLIFKNIKFYHPGIRFGLPSVISFSDRLLRRELANVL